MPRFLAAALLACVTFFGPLSFVFAGWLEVDQDGNRSYISDGKIKDVGSEEGTWTVFDSVSGELLMVDDERRVYTRAPVSEYCLSMQAAADQVLQQMSPEERAVMEQMMGGLTKRPAEGKQPAVSVSSLGKGEDIAGFATERYQVKVDGKLHEELWLAPDAPVHQELNMEGLKRSQTEMSRCLQAGPFGARIGPSPEETPEYEAMARKGWAMRSIQYDAGEPRTRTEIVSLEKRDIPSAEFQPPADYRQVDVREFME